MVMRIKQVVIHDCSLSKMKNNILLNCLQGNYRNSLGEFSNTSYGVLHNRHDAEVSKPDELTKTKKRQLPIIKSLVSFGRSVIFRNAFFATSVGTA